MILIRKRCSQIDMYTHASSALDKPVILTFDFLTSGSDSEHAVVDYTFNSIYQF